MRRPDHARVSLDVSELAELLGDELGLQRMDDVLRVKIFLLLAYEAGVTAQREIILDDA